MRNMADVGTLFKYFTVQQRTTPNSSHSDDQTIADSTEINEAKTTPSIDHTAVYSLTPELCSEPEAVLSEVSPANLTPRSVVKQSKKGRSKLSDESEAKTKHRTKKKPTKYGSKKSAKNENNLCTEFMASLAEKTEPAPSAEASVEHEAKPSIETETKPKPSNKSKKILTKSKDKKSIENEDNRYIESKASLAEKTEAKQSTQTSVELEAKPNTGNKSEKKLTNPKAKKSTTNSAKLSIESKDSLTEKTKPRLSAESSVELEAKSSVKSEVKQKPSSKSKKKLAKPKAKKSVENEAKLSIEFKASLAEEAEPMPYVETSLDFESKPSFESEAKLSADTGDTLSIELHSSDQQPNNTEKVDYEEFLRELRESRSSADEAAVSAVNVPFLDSESHSHNEGVVCESPHTEELTKEPVVKVPDAITDGFINTGPEKIQSVESTEDNSIISSKGSEKPTPTIMDFFTRKRTSTQRREELEPEEHDKQKVKKPRKNSAKKVNQQSSTPPDEEGVAVCESGEQVECLADVESSSLSKSVYGSNHESKINRNRVSKSTKNDSLGNESDAESTLNLTSNTEALKEQSVHVESLINDSLQNSPSVTESPSGSQSSTRRLFLRDVKRKIEERKAAEAQSDGKAAAGSTKPDHLESNLDNRFVASLSATDSPCSSQSMSRDSTTRLSLRDVKLKIKERKAAEALLVKNNFKNSSISELKHKRDHIGSDTKAKRKTKQGTKCGISDDPVENPQVLTLATERDSSTAEKSKIKRTIKKSKNRRALQHCNTSDASDNNENRGVSDGEVTEKPVKRSTLKRNKKLDVSSVSEDSQEPKLTTRDSELEEATENILTPKRQKSKRGKKSFVEKTTNISSSKQTKSKKIKNVAVELSADQTVSPAARQKQSKKRKTAKTQTPREESPNKPNGPITVEIVTSVDDDSDPGSQISTPVRLKRRSKKCTPTSRTKKRKILSEQPKSDDDIIMVAEVSSPSTALRDERRAKLRAMSAPDDYANLKQPKVIEPVTQAELFPRISHIRQLSENVPEYECKLKLITSSDKEITSRYSTLQLNIERCRASKGLKHKKEKLTQSKISREVKRLDTLLPHYPVLDIYDSIDSRVPESGEVANQLWTSKYSPTTSSQLLIGKGHIEVINEWLLNWKRDIINGQISANRKQKKKSKRKRNQFINDSDSEDGEVEWTQTPVLVISGSSGLGKTTCAHTIASKLGYKVFEINPSMLRTTRTIMEKVHESTQSHQVQKGKGISLDKIFDKLNQADSKPVPVNSITSFFTKMKKKQNVSETQEKDESKATSTAEDSVAKPSSKCKIKQKASTASADSAEDTEEETPDSAAETVSLSKLSLILFDEADIAFEEDKGFYDTIKTLGLEARKPIIITCQSTHFLRALGVEYTHVEITPHINSEVAAYLCLLCLVENELADFSAMLQLVNKYKCDIRRCILQVQYLVTSGGLENLLSESTASSKTKKKRKSKSLSSPLSNLAKISRYQTMLDVVSMHHQRATSSSRLPLVNKINSNRSQVFVDCGGLSHTAPDPVVCSSVKHLKSAYTEQLKNTFNLPDTKSTSQSLDIPPAELMVAIREELPPHSSDIPDNVLSLDYFPFMQAVCAAEEDRKDQKSSRRFLHFLDKSGLFVSDDEKRKLIETFQSAT